MKVLSWIMRNFSPFLKRGKGGFWGEIKKSGILVLIIFLFSLLFLPAWGSEGGLIYLVQTDPRTVDILEPELSTKVGSIPVGETPLNIALSPDRKFLAVSHWTASEERPGTLWIIDRAEKKVIRKIMIYMTRYRDWKEIFVVFSKDGKKLYAVESGTGFLDVVRTSDWKFVKKINLGIQPQNPVLSSDGKFLYVPNLYSRDIMVVDTREDIVVDSIKIDGLPSAVDLDSDGKTLYVADIEGHRVLFIDLSTRAVIKQISAGSVPSNILLVDGRFLYVLNTYSNNLSIIDVVKKENIKSMGAGILPRKMTYDSNGKRLYVVSEDAAIVVVDTAKQKWLKSIPADITPAGIVFAP